MTTEYKYYMEEIFFENYKTYSHEEIVFVYFTGLDSYLFR